MSALPSSDRFGHGPNGLTDVERTARLRSLRAIVRLLCGPPRQAHDTCLEQAETDTDAPRPLRRRLGRLAPIDRRQVLASFAAMHRPTPSRVGERVR